MIPNGTLTLYFEIKLNSFHPNAKKKTICLKKDQQLFNVTGDLLFVEWPVIYCFWIVDQFHILCGAFAQEEDSEDISKTKKCRSFLCHIIYKDMGVKLSLIKKKSIESERKIRADGEE